MNTSSPRQNGKRSFSINPLALLAWAPGSGYSPVSETEAVVALGWIFRQMATWKTKRNVFDLMRTGSGCGHTCFPDLCLEGDAAASHLRTLVTRMVSPTEFPEFAAFAEKSLGFRGVGHPFLIRARRPSKDVFGWLRDLYGCRLKTSPNEFHPGAVWLHGARLHLNSRGNRWRVVVTYSYRHEDSSWGISLEQAPGEKLEDFDARAWKWLSEQLAFRHPEEFYRRFFVPADGMKRNELASCATAERRMWQTKDALRQVFSWGAGAPGLWEQRVAEPLVRDASDQFREMGKIAMTASRLRAVIRWAAEDRREAEAKRAGAA